MKDLALDLKCLQKDLEFSSEFERVTNGSQAGRTAEIVKQATIAEKARRFFGFEILAAGLLIVLAAGFFCGFSAEEPPNNPKRPKLPRSKRLKSSTGLPRPANSTVSAHFLPMR